MATAKDTKIDELLPLSTEVRERTADSFIKLIEYYERFFTQAQVNALLYFWYGFGVEEVANDLNLDQNTISDWLNDRFFREAIEQGLGAKREIIVHCLQRSTFKAARVVGEILDSPIGPSSRGYTEKIRTARWLIDRENLINSDSKDGDERLNTRATEETLKLMVREMQKSSDPVDVEVSTIFGDDVLDGIIVDPATYYNLVQQKNSIVENGVVNIIINEEGEYKMQCHLCGKWYTSVAAHVRSSAHSGVNSQFYRIHFGIPEHIPLAVDEKFFEIIEKGKD